MKLITSDRPATFGKEIMWSVLVKRYEREHEEITEENQRRAKAGEPTYGIEKHFGRVD